MSYLKRRELLQRTLMATAGGAAFGLLPHKLAMAQSSLLGGSLLRGSGVNDYKALVCIYLYGGNDCFNMVIPRDNAGYADYRALRIGNGGGADDTSNLAVPQADLLPLNPTSGPVNGGQYGLNPAMAGLKQMFDAGRAAIVANVGPLVRPTTKAMFQTPGTLLPAQLFSHSDQSVLWQTPRADSVNRIGWGGRLADKFRLDNPNQTLSMNVSLSGDNVFQAGENVAPYFMNTYGVEQIGEIQTAQANCLPTNEWNRRRCLSFKAMQDLANTASPGHAFERAYVKKTKSSIETAAQVKVAIALFPPTDARFAPFWSENGLTQNTTNENVNALPDLAQQLLMVARVIAARTSNSLNMKRQLFFAAIGGFDTHDKQRADHAPLLRDISQSVRAFYRVMDNLDATLANNVTAFTASDFGRTLTNNGDGTDHGWGAHHLVFGQAVNGNRIYGKMPSLKPTDSNPDDVDGGRLVPTLSTDQYAHTLAKWYGLVEADRLDLFPNLTFMDNPILGISGSDLGFMQPT
jgi:uncharacterized protein (DUF1501 family)